MTTPATNYLLWLLPCWLSVAILAIVLLLRENQNAKIQKGLIDRLLTKEGLEPLPDIAPLDFGPSDETKERIEAVAKEIQRRKHQSGAVVHKIPNMPVGMGDVGVKR